MGYPFEEKPPSTETFGPAAKPEMSFDAVMRFFYGDGNIKRYPTDVPAMSRDAWPSVNAADHPHTMLQPAFKELDFLSIPATAEGRRGIFSRIQNELVAITEEWKHLGLPTKDDEWRKMELPDTAALAEKILAEGGGTAARTVAQNYEYVCHLVASADNMSKFTFQRYVPPLWYAQDMSANHVRVTPLLRRAASVLDRIASAFFKSHEGRQGVSDVLSGYSDPFGTAVGWPLFTSTAEVGEEEIKEDAKLAILAQFDNALHGVNYRDEEATFQLMKQKLKGRVAGDFLRDNPLAYLVNRRSRVGGKFNPDWAMRGEPVLTGELRGAPYARIAQAAPWLGNLIQGTIFPYFKAFRMSLTGCYHTQQEVNTYLQALKRPGTFVMESDISAYDLNFAIEVTDIIDDIISKYTAKPKLALSILRAIRRTPVVMPAPDNVGNQRDAVVIGGEIMMPSGIKLTAEYGTLGNVLVTIMYQLERGEREADIVKYWRGSDNNHRARWLMQGDDKAVLGNSIPAMVKQITQEAELYPSIGVTAKVEICDRFLQKHMYGGRITPVASRILQQRLGNEHSPDGIPQMVVGLTASCSGMLGYYLTDSIERKEIKLGADDARVSNLHRRILAVVEYSFKNAGAPVPIVLEFMEALLSEKGGTGRVAKLHALNERAVHMLMKDALKEDQFDEITGASRLLTFFDRNKYSSSIQDFLDDLERQSPEWAKITREYEGKKVNFARLAYKTIGLPQGLMIKDGWEPADLSDLAPDVTKDPAPLPLATTGAD